jgi:PBSX family phage terminase large subunit
MRKINPNFVFLQQALKYQRYEGDKLVSGKRGCVLEGSSRSGKTWGGVDTIGLICSRYETNAIINIVKETYNEFKTTLYNDFRKRLNDWNVPNPFESKQEVQSFKLWGNQINLLGADRPSKFHGAQCDYLWLNEALPIEKNIFDQAEMRCSKFWWMDYNPSVTEHWIYNSVVTRPYVGFLQTTWKDNPFVSVQEKNKIMGYEPTEENIRNGTADDYMFKVYNQGLRGSPQGLIFNNVRWIDQFPPELGYMYGMDFGFVSDPTAIVKYSETPTDIYAELLCYEPMDNANIIHDYAIKKGINIAMPVIADNADKYTSEFKGTVQMVRDLQNLGWINLEKVRKNKSVVYWLGSMKQKRLNLVRNEFRVQLKREVENYKNREIHGIVVNEPVDKWNHAIDAIRYPHMHLHQMEEMAM